MSMVRGFSTGSTFKGLQLTSLADTIYAETVSRSYFQIWIQSELRLNHPLKIRYKDKNITDQIFHLLSPFSKVLKDKGKAHILIYWYSII